MCTDQERTPRYMHDFCSRNLTLLKVRVRHVVHKNRNECIRETIGIVAVQISALPLRGCCSPLPFPVVVVYFRSERRWRLSVSVFVPANIKFWHVLMKSLSKKVISSAINSAVKECTILDTRAASTWGVLGYTSSTSMRPCALSVPPPYTTLKIGFITALTSTWHGRNSPLSLDSMSSMSSETKSTSQTLARILPKRHFVIC